MGMYTGLRFKGVIKPEYREMIEAINEDDAEWEDFVHRYSFLSEFASLPRSGMIPCGCLSYMPDSWEDTSINTAGFENKFDYETGYWTFQCSLKNYHGEIGIFISTVLPHILEESHHIEEMYEEWESSKMYEMKDKEVLVIEGVQYYNFFDPKAWGN